MQTSSTASTTTPLRHAFERRVEDVKPLKRYVQSLLRTFLTALAGFLPRFPKPNTLYDDLYQMGISPKNYACGEHNYLFIWSSARRIFLPAVNMGHSKHITVLTLTGLVVISTLWSWTTSPRKVTPQLQPNSPKKQIFGHSRKKNQCGHARRSNIPSIWVVFKKPLMPWMIWSLRLV